jgi:U3 small nucleolar RNA-associated protein 22
LAAVNSKSQDSFDTTFVLNVATPLLQYDEIYSIKISAGLFNTEADERQLLHKLHRTLVRGLGDRASLIDLKLPPRSGWALDKESTHGKGDYELEIGLLTNPDTVSRLVDRGPSADEQERAAEFRRFWGEKAELRRFKDGSISEALVWSQSAPVMLQIIAYLAMLHFRLPPSSIKTKKQNLESIILKDDEQSAPVSPTDAFRLINSTFQTLTSTLHNLEGLPLPIRSISPASSALRSTSTLHPLLPSTTSPIDILIQFDSSTRWPDSLPAVQHTKIAFLLKLSECLAEVQKELTTRVGLENTDSATTGHSNTSFLDVIHPAPAPGLSPICFRLRIYHDREAHLLQTALADKSLHGSMRDSLARALAAHKRDFQAKTAHTLTMKNLITKFPPLSPTVRLLKRWISSHLLSAHVPEEVLEIIGAHIFLYPAPWDVPGSATTAFLRCLHFLSRWDWSLTALIVDLSLSQDGVADAQRAEMETRFQAWRKLDPNMNTVVWFVGSNVDGTGTVWTGNACPPRVLAGRVTALAKAAINMIEGKRLEDEGMWKGLFVGDLGDYDFVIHLKSSVVRGGKGRKKTGRTALEGMEGVGEFKNLQIAQSLDVDSIGYNPVELYLRDLNHAFGSSALFFYDQNGGKVIAGLWRPSVLGRKAWRVRLGWSSVPVPVSAEEDGEKAKDMCVFNREAVVAEMVKLGEGLVKEVKLKE